MIKVLYGIQKEIINKYINNYIKEQKIDSVIKYDYIESGIESLINEINTLDLFSTNKLIIVYNPLFLTSKETLDNKSFNNYLLNSNQNINLLFILYESKLDERKKIVKLIKENYTTSEFNAFNAYDAEKYISNEFKKDNYKIENNSIKKIIEFLGLNFGLYDNEIEKLKTFKLNEKQISIKDVELITSRVPEENLFKLFDAIILNDKETIFSVYKDLCELEIESYSIVGFLAKQVRFLYEVFILLNKGNNIYDITRILNANQYRVGINIKKASILKEEEILNILYKLSLVDIELKTTGGEIKSSLEGFFLEL